ncbi:hypothetical protein IQB76_00010 [Leptospira borgpetersenii serovar Hardjo-bovis]|uniref:LIC_11904 family protein n=1 Tax=Leptospira borgpetersenii TaxID=174 RepID=UPI0000E57798|nr:hypothetical protein [Leptospira borgpetersenii]ABJ78804.1 Hypothetical protein LBL_1311 [Leptospira borgpetersenii serovar Hardjo-bovis str. L550]AMX58078.1 hypothetical protein LBK6_06910 [Leptospira borgpetersenii serovar Hardjo]AMX61330.1 hypothetical protein LBK9_06925 [Leptospira borgpetersenii serovar Hardjo]AMX64575.1 hypothetical protein LBK30_06990 [Leptospira borgpetersenii serovar Hardjo]AMX67793.1 hypothetical protein LBHA_06850 [Leptospira borgpetersenii serovar Hardjo]
MIIRKSICLFLIGFLSQCNGIIDNKNRSVINNLALFLRSDSFTYSPEGNPVRLFETKVVETNFLYQLNPELVARVGAFFTIDASDPPRATTFSHVAGITLAPNLRPANFQSVDFTIFMLDSVGGNLYFSVGANRLYYKSNTDFIGARRISLEENGRIAFLKSEAVNLCWSFDGQTSQRINGCQNTVSISGAQELVSFGPSAFLVYGPNIGFRRLGIDGAVTTISSPVPITGLRSVWADPSLILVVDQDGKRIVGWDPRDRSIIFKWTDQKLVTDTATLELTFTVAAPLPGGMGLAVLPENSDTVLFVNRSFQLIGGLTSPSSAYPLRRINPIQGVSVNLLGGTIGIWSSRGVNVSAIDQNANYDFTYLLPDSLTTLPQVLNDPTVSGALQADPRTDLLDVPAVRNSLTNLRSQL